MDLICVYLDACRAGAMLMVLSSHLYMSSGFLLVFEHFVAITFPLPYFIHVGLCGKEYF